MPHIEYLIKKIQNKSENINWDHVDIRDNSNSLVAHLYNLEKALKSPESKMDNELNIKNYFHTINTKITLLKKSVEKHPKLETFYTNLQNHFQALKKELEPIDDTITLEKKIDTLSKNDTERKLLFLNYIASEIERMLFDINFIDKVLSSKNTFAFVGYLHATTTRNFLIKKCNFREIETKNCSNLSTRFEEIINDFGNEHPTFDETFAQSLKDCFGKLLNIQSKQNEKTEKHCSYCKIKDFETKKLLLCSRCKKTFYCDAICQKEDWNGHKIICNKASQ